jgi:hypothetical protein
MLLCNFSKILNKPLSFISEELLDSSIMLLNSLRLWNCHIYKSSPSRGLTVKMSSPPINPTPCRYLRIHTPLYPRVKWEAVTREVGYPDEGNCDTCWIAGLWSTHIKGEGIVLKAACHWVVQQCCERCGWGTGLHPTVCRPSLCMRLRGRWTNVLPDFMRGLLNWGLWRIWMNE